MNDIGEIKQDESSPIIKEEFKEINKRISVINRKRFVVFGIFILLYLIILLIVSLVML